MPAKAGIQIPSYRRTPVSRDTKCKTAWTPAFAGVTKCVAYAGVTKYMAFARVTS